MSHTPAPCNCATGHGMYMSGGTQSFVAVLIIMAYAYYTGISPLQADPPVQRQSRPVMVSRLMLKCPLLCMWKIDLPHACCDTIVTGHVTRVSASRCSSL